MALYEATLGLTQKVIAFDGSQVNDKVFRSVGWEGDQQTTEPAKIVPQVYFLQNVLPTERGYSSVHFTKVVNEHTYPKYLDQLSTLRAASGNVGLFSYANGANLVYTKETGTWVSKDMGYTGAPTSVTYAYLKGVTYLYLGGIGVYVYNFETQSFTLQSFGGILSYEDIIGISSAGSYLLLYTSQYVLWSTPSNPVEFSPLDGGGASTGAGQSAILAVRGEITVVLPIAGGAIVYTTVNAVGMRLTNNANFPFSFAEISGSAGVETSQHVSFESTSDAHFAWTTSGLQLLNIQKAELVFPELSDSIAASSYTTYSNGKPTTLFLTATDVRISSVGSRFIIVSIRSKGASEFPIAYVLDLALDRWGRLDIPHIDIFDYRKPEFAAKITFNYLLNTPFTSLAATPFSQLKTVLETKTAQFGLTFGIINKVGGVFVALQSNYANLTTLEASQNASGAKTPLILFGRFKLVRPQGLNLQKVKVTKLYDGEVAVCSHEQNGSHIKAKVLTQSSREAGTYRALVSGAQLSIRLSGRFMLTELSIQAENAGGGLLPVAEAGAPSGDSQFVVVNSAEVVVDDDFTVVSF